MPTPSPKYALSIACLAGLVVIALALAGQASAVPRNGADHNGTSGATAKVSIGIKARLSERSGADLAAVVSKLRRSGVSIVREDIPWSTIEPQPGAYYWGSMDRWISVAARKGLRVMGVLASPPNWATGHWNVAPAGRSQIADFAGFVRKVVSRYGSEGTFWRQHPGLPALPIRYWDIWNEPYESRFWAQGSPDPEGYARMFKAVVQASRSADPTARFMLEADTRVVSTGWPWKPFLSAMFNAVPDLGKYAYGVSVHPYQGDGGSPRSCSPSIRYAGVSSRWQATALQFCRILDIRHILNAHGARGVKLWITEIGWSTAPEAERAVSEATQASYVHQVFDLLRTKYRGLVSGLIWYEYQGSESNPTELGDYLGLVHSDGTPKPAWQAFVDEATGGI